MPAKLRILLADDHAVLRAGLERLISAQADMEVVGQASGGRDAVRLAQELLPDVVVLDISMPDLEGVAATAQMKQICPQVRVLAFTRHDDPGYLQRMLQAGAAGYVLKAGDTDELIAAIRVVAAGGSYVDRQLDWMLAGRDDAPPSPAAPAYAPGVLTARETEVLRLIAAGRKTTLIAEQLRISAPSVAAFRASAMVKLGLRSRVDIVRYALAQGWLDEEADVA